MYLFYPETINFKCQVLLSYAKLIVSFGQKQKENSSIMIALGFEHDWSIVNILVPPDSSNARGSHSPNQSGGDLFVSDQLSSLKDQH